MQLSPTDSLRLNVLLNQQLQAIRIDEGKMILYGLTERGEAKIQLSANCKEELYIRRVKELISSHVLGSPGGYPVFLKRWTRMGQARSENLESLLKLGEPEAVIAVVGAAGLTNELARRAWWAMPDADNARRMLARPDVASGDMGKILAEFLVEFLPFEEEPRNMIESVRLVLQPDLISEEVRAQLWSRGQRKHAYLVGFLKALPDAIPEPAVAHPQWESWQDAVTSVELQNNPFVQILQRIMAREGQAYLQTISAVLDKPANQDVVVALFDAIEHYFMLIRPHQEKRRDIEQLLQEAQCLARGEATCAHSEAIAELKRSLPDAQPMIESLLVFSCIGEQLIAPIFATTDAVGTVMRKKIEPIVKPMLRHLQHLQGLSL